MSLTIVAGDRHQPVIAAIKDGSGPFDLTSATVKARVRRANSGTTLFNATCTVLNTVAGTAQMDWPASWETTLQINSVQPKSDTCLQIQWEVTKAGVTATSTTITKVKVKPRFADAT